MFFYNTTINSLDYSEAVSTPSALIDFFLDVLFPQFCAGCKKEGHVLCETCRAGISPGASVCFVCEKRSPDGLVCESCKGKTRIRRFISPFSYANPVIRELIQRLKYGGTKEVADDLGGWVARSVRFSALPLPQEAVLIPIPLHGKRLRSRGFNQAELIASAIGKRLNVRLDASLLKRTEHRTPQTEMKKREERLSNAAGIYKVAGAVPAETLILVDDVSTTGATLEEAATVLKQAGAKQVWAFVVAR